MKFDYVIQNPPYSKSLHLEFLKKGLELLAENGKMVVIEPATWLINVRKTGKAKIYDEIKEKLEGHVSRVVIENYNEEFGIHQFVPFSICEIDLGQEFEEIELISCGEKRTVKSLYDCNLVGDYAVIWSILDKIDCDKAVNHIFVPHKSEHKEGLTYRPFASIGGHFCNHCEGDWIESKFGQHYFYTSFLVHKTSGEISDSVTVNRNGNKYNCLVGTREELENWKHFATSNKLALFISAVMSIDQHNNALDYEPWLVDKQYTDEEINEKFGLNEEETDLIDKTIKKYEKSSDWYRRYLFGPSAVKGEKC